MTDDMCHRHRHLFRTEDGCPGCLDERLKIVRLVFLRECAILAGTHTTSPFIEGTPYLSQVLPTGEKPEWMKNLLLRNAANSPASRVDLRKLQS
jgi:hypothetical protein